MTDGKLLKKKKSILTGIRKGIVEVKEHRKSGKPLQTLSDFLANGDK